MTNRIIANRTDGTTERLMAVFNGLYIAEKCGLNFSFRWPMSDAQTTGAQRVPYVDELFSAEFIEKYHDTTSDFSAIPKLPNTRKAKNIQALLDIVKNGSWLSSKDHLAEKYSNSTQLRYDFTNNFTESIFSTKVVEAVKKARSIDSDVQNWVSIHLRAGDVIYGRYRHHGIFAHMCIPLPVAKFLIGNLEKNGQKSVLFGQDHNTISYLNDSGLPCFSAAEYYQKLNIDDDLSRLIFDVVLMSKTSRIIAGGSGVPRFASCIGANQLIHYQDIVTADQQYELTDSDVQENAVHYTGLQSAFAYWAAYFRASNVTPHEQADHYLKMASIYDPENYCYRIKRLGLNFRALQDETAEEILRVDGCADDEDAARRLTRALLTRNLAIYGFLFDQELRVIAVAATRKNRGAKAIMRQILQFAANPRYKFADDLHKLLPDTLTLAAVQETPEPHRFTFYVNEWVGEVEVEVPGDVAIIPISAASHDDGTFRMAKMKGDNNILYLGEGADIKKVVFDVVGNGNKMIVGRNAQLKGMISFRGNNNVIFIGAGTTFNSATLIAKYSANIYIGRDCMFSSGIEVRTSDSHSIVDLETMMKSNDSQGVFIGDHVWVSKNVVVQKGAAIAADNVIGISSFVRGHFPDSSTIIVGSPARVAKTGKSWARNELFDAEKEELYAWKNLPLA